MVLEYPSHASVRLVLGASKTGKTSRLVDYAESLVCGGVAGSDVVAIAATPDAAHALKSRLDTACPQADIPVCTARQIALEVLSKPQAISVTGRKPRLLTRFESSFLMDDMKASGLRPRRIAELARFFYRSWAELADFDEGWLIFKEEEENHARLKSLLDTYSAYVEPELANSAIRYLACHEDALEAEQVPYVIVDDYQCLSRASQHLLYMLAKNEVFVAGNPDACVPAFDSYPHAAGIAELQQKASIVETVVLDKSLLPCDTFDALTSLAGLVGSSRDGKQERAVESLTARTGATQGQGFEIACCNDPVDECEKAVDWVGHALDEGVEPAHIAIVVPNKTWERNMANRLEQYGIHACRASSQGDIGGDVRYKDLSHPAQIVTLLALAADKSDGAALRSWCGFGDYLTCRQLFSEVYQRIHDSGRDLADEIAYIAGLVLEQRLESDETLMYKNEARKLANVIEQLQYCLGELKELTGLTMVEKAAELITGTHRIPPALVHIFDAVEPNDTAQDIYGKALRALHFPMLSDDGVKVLPVERMVGLDMRAVALTGMVSGFTPQHSYFDRTKKSPEQAARMLARNAESYLGAIGQGVEKCALFTFETMKGSDAERHDVRVDRFYAKDGIRYGLVHQSLLVDCIQGIEIKEV